MFRKILTSKRITFYNNIDYKSATEFINTILDISNDGSNDDILLILSSNGGCIDSSFAIYNIIKSIENKVFCLANGTVASGAGIISLACDYKWAYNNTVFFTHQIQGEMQEADGNKMHAKLESLKILEEHIYDIYLKNTHMSKKNIKNLLSKDSYFSAQTALTYGIIDEIVLP